MNKITKLLHTVVVILIFALALTLVSCSQTPPDDSGQVDTDGSGDNTDGEGETEGDGETEGEIETCEHIYTEQSRTEAMPLRNGEASYKCLLCNDEYSETVPASRSIKILVIGHSYSIDTTTYLWDICKSGGAQSVVIGNLYIAGCPLNAHWSNIQSNAKSYRYYKNTSGKWTTREETSIYEALIEEKWDIIVLQQGPTASGLPSHYSNLSNIVSYVNQNKTNPNAQIWWHLTWADQQDHMEEYDTTYNKNQLTKYNAIVDAYKTAVKGVIPDRILPSGTVVQNLRTTYLGDTLTRDGYHMSYDHGRYSTALLWYTVLTGGSLNSVSWLPEKYTYLKDDIAIIHEAINNAIENPLEITSSAHTAVPTDEQLFENGGLDISDYELLEFTVTAGGYYDSATGSALITTDTEKSPYYCATSLINRTDMPKGSVIIVDRGYKANIQVWQDEGTPTVTDTPIDLTSRLTVVNREWWTYYKVRAINVSHSDVTVEMSEADVGCIRIYVPKS